MYEALRDPLPLVLPPEFQESSNWALQRATCELVESPLLIRQLHVPCGTVPPYKRQGLSGGIERNACSSPIDWPTTAWQRGCSDKFKLKLVSLDAPMVKQLLLKNQQKIKKKNWKTINYRSEGSYLLSLRY